MTTKFPKALAAAGLAAVLVGCGGGGSETARMETPEDTGPTLEQKQATQRMAINEAITAFNTALAKVNNDAPESDVTAADAALEAILAAINAAADLPDAEKNAHMTTYNNSKRSLDGAKARRKKYMDDKKDKMEMEEAAARKKARDDAAKLWVAAITDYKVGTSVTAFSALSSEITDLKIDYKNNTTTITLDDANEVPIRNTADSRSPSTGWTAKRFTAEEDKKRGVILTNRGGATDKSTMYSYANFFFSKDSTTGQANLASPKTDPITGVNAAANTGILTIGTGAKLRNSDFGSRPTGFAAGGNLRRNVRFLNVPGILVCSSAPCTVNDNGDGTFSFSESVTFTPSNANLNDIILTHITPADNSKYLSFGYWLVTSGPVDDLKHKIHTFAQNHKYPAIAADATVLKVSASYTGGAAGVYVLKTGDLTDSPDLHDGEFVADVDLKAQFDSSGRVADDKEWMITGNINDFRSSTNDTHNLSGWDLVLSADLGTRNASNAATNPNVVSSASLTGLTKMVTNGGATPGSWIATFHGNAGIGTTANADDDHPEAVVGEFDGHFVNGHVVGAFGAVKDD